MRSQTDLGTLLRTMEPVLHKQPYVFCSLSEETFRALQEMPLGTFVEEEGVSCILSQSQATEHGLPFEQRWACLTLSVHSSLMAVGFLARITGKLAEAGISVNPVSATYHDHLFVPWDEREQALHQLNTLSSES